LARRGGARRAGCGGCGGGASSTSGARGLADRGEGALRFGATPARGEALRFASPRAISSARILAYAAAFAAAACWRAVAPIGAGGGLGGGGGALGSFLGFFGGGGFTFVVRAISSARIFS